MEIITVITGLYATNTYIIADGGEAVIIDPADGTDTICEVLNNKKLTPRAVLVTHGHFDHIGSVARLQSLGAKVYISEADYEFFLRYKDTAEYSHVAMFTADVKLRGGETLNLCNHKYEVILTPGHTPGGVCYILDDQTIFSGDTLFRLSIGRTDFPMSDGAEMKRSLNKLFALPHDYTVLPGHADRTTLDYERRNNPYAIY